MIRWLIMFRFTTKYLLNSTSHIFDPQCETSSYIAPHICPPIPSYALLTHKPCMNFSRFWLVGWERVFGTTKKNLRGLLMRNPFNSGKGLNISLENIINNFLIFKKYFLNYVKYLFFFIKKGVVIHNILFAKRNIFLSFFFHIYPF